MLHRMKNTDTVRHFCLQQEFMCALIVAISMLQPQRKARRKVNSVCSGLQECLYIFRTISYQMYIIMSMLLFCVVYPIFQGLRDCLHADCTMHAPCILL